MLRIGSDELLGCCVLGKESPTKEGREQWNQLFDGVLDAFTNFDCQLNNTQKIIENYKFENVPNFINTDSIYYYNKNTNNHNYCINNLLKKKKNRQKFFFFKKKQNYNKLSNNNNKYLNNINETLMLTNKNNLLNNNLITNQRCSFLSTKSKLSISMEIERCGYGTTTFIVPPLTINCYETINNKNDSFVNFIYLN